MTARNPGKGIMNTRKAIEGHAQCKPRQPPNNSVSPINSGKSE